MIVLLKRREDGRFDIYRQPGLALDPALAQVGGELGEWRQAAIEQPVSLPLFVMGGCDLVRRSARAFEIRIDGRKLTTGRLPGAWLHRRRLVKYTADPTVVVVSRAHDGPIGTAGSQAVGGVEVAAGAVGIAGLRASGGGHRAQLALEPALPDLATLAPGAHVAGVWRLAVDDDPAVVGGTWSAQRRRDRRVDLVLDVTRGWRPRGLPPLMAAVTRLAPVFRTWPTTYRWSATVILGDQPTLRSRWERTDDRRDRSYRRLTT
jgi:hypothetical protein